MSKAHCSRATPSSSTYSIDRPPLYADNSAVYSLRSIAWCGALLAWEPSLALAESGPVHSAMMFNVLFSSADHQANLDVIASRQPDFVCLREIPPGFAKEFVTRLGDKYPYRHYRRHPTQPAWGVAIASRYPTSDWRVFLEKPYFIPAADVVVNLPDGELRVGCVHLIPPVARYQRGEAFWDTMQRNTLLRVRQAKYLAFRYRSERRPVMILGDFNEDPDDPAMQLLDDRGYRNSCVIKGDECQDSWPAWSGPGMFRFDQIIGRRLKFTSSRVVEEGGSDHFPVAVEFTLDAPTAAPAPNPTPAAN